MNGPPHITAIVVSTSHTECLSYLLAVTLFIAPLVAARLSPRPFFGGLFALALAPFLTCSLISFVRLQAAVSYAEDFARHNPENVIQRLHEVSAPASLGLITTAAALILHWVLCFITRRHPPVR